MDKANGQLNNKKGKHYVMGDLHGMYGTYMDAVNSINDEDTLYILGDVIDNGPHGIKIIQDIMKRPNVKLILGNHEWEFMKCYEIMKEYDLSVSEFSIYTRMNEFIQKLNEELISEESYIRGIMAIKDQLKAENLKVKPIQTSELAHIGAWIKDGGLPTLREFDKLNGEEQEQIVKFLTDSIILGLLNINGKKECLVHATPYDQKFFIALLSRVRYEEFIRYVDLLGIKPKVLEHFVEGCTGRGLDQFKGKKNNPFDDMHRLGYETLYGHTPQAGQATKCRRDGSICLDVSNDGAALYCIEDGLVRYIGRGFDEPTGRISEPRAPKVIDDRLEEYIKENDIQSGIISEPQSPSYIFSSSENPSDPDDPGDR